LFASYQVPEVVVAWQGGEPTLMGLDFFKRAVELAEEYKQPGQSVTYTMQTNGTRLDDNWCAFFQEHNFLIGLSLDGPAELHDPYRVDKKGQGTFDQVMSGWALLHEHRVDINILCAIHAANAAHPLQVYRFFRDGLKARFLQFIPIVERLTLETRPQAGKEWGAAADAQRPLYRQVGRGVSHRSVKQRQWGRFLIDIFDEWVRHDVGKVFVQAFDAALANWYSRPAGVCVFQETCGLALEHNGDLYACDHFVEPGYRRGNILERPLSPPVALPDQRRFGLDKRDTLPAYCRTCDVRFACHGECPRNRFLKTPAGEEGLNYLCVGYKLFFHHIDRPMRIMADLLRRWRAPVEIMQQACSVR
jgi:uncharacterized protein